MQYEIVDLSGSTLNYFSHRREAIEALRAEEERKPGISAELLLLTIGDDGEERGEPERAKLLLENVAPTEVVISAGFDELGGLNPIRTGGWSGSVQPMSPESRHQSEGAIESPDLDLGEKVPG